MLIGMGEGNNLEEGKMGFPKRRRSLGPRVNVQRSVDQSRKDQLGQSQSYAYTQKFLLLGKVWRTESV